VHLVLAIVLWNFKLDREDAWMHTVVVVPMGLDQRQEPFTFLALPPDFAEAYTQVRTPTLRRIKTALRPRVIRALILKNYERFWRRLLRALRG